VADFQTGRLLRIFVDDSDSWHGTSLSSAIVEMLHKNAVSGASVFRGVEGFGAHREVHLAKIFKLWNTMPIVIEVVDREEKIAELIPKIEAMVTEAP